MTEQEAYLVLQKASGIEVGDTVRVVRRAESEELGWGEVWADRDEIFLEKSLECVVIKDLENSGFRIRSNQDNIETTTLPFFCLELVEKKKEEYRFESLPKSIANEFDKCDFDCQRKNVYRLVRAIWEECKNKEESK